jgi:hypothetical protein
MLAACHTKPPSASFAAYEVEQIRTQQTVFFKMKGHYGTLAELYQEGLVVGDKRNNDDISDGQVHGYNFDIKVYENGYSATATPVKDRTTFPQQASFYVDNQVNRVKVHYGAEAGPNSPDYVWPY